MNVPSIYALIKMTDHTTATAQSLFDILTKATVPTGWSRSTEQFAINTSSPESNLTPAFSELQFQGQGPGLMYFGSDSQVTTTHYGFVAGAGDGDLKRSILNNKSLREVFIIGDTDNCAISIWADKA